jgi:aspartyl-tRNA(Asn)/glutamyl-tRNA(Gln) amidotransferase subunit C
MSKITALEVRHVAKLSRLSLTDAEIHSYADQLSVVFSYIEMLREVDTTGVTETSQVTGLMDVFREDVVVSSADETVRRLIDGFPEKLGRLLRVKKVFD